METRILLLVSLFIYSASCWASEDAAVSVHVSEVGQLESLLGERINSIESLTVTGGPIDATDFKTILKASLYGQLVSVNLKEATVIDNKIPDWAFYDVNLQVHDQYVRLLPLRKIILPDNIESIGQYAFTYTMLEDITLPSSLKSLGVGSFQNCQHMKMDKFVVPEGITEIPFQCFKNNRGVKEFVLPTTIRSIDGFAFDDARMERINFPDGLESIGINALQGCELLSEAILPNSCTDIQTHAFYMCYNLEKMRLPETLAVIPSNLAVFSALTEISIPKMAKEIDEFAFGFCERLSSVKIPEGLEKIASYAFLNCNLESIKLPSTLSMLGSACLKGTKGDVYALPQNPPLCTGPEPPFDIESDPDKTLYVPMGTSEAYRAAWGWSDFKNIVETDFAFLSGKGEMETDMRDASIDITTSDGCIEINASGRRYGRYIVSTMDGRIIAAGDIKQSKTTINITQGLYVVSAANATRKVAVH